MKIFYIISICLYLITLGSYLIVETKNNKKNRAINKIILASMFVVISLVSYFVYDMNNISKIVLLVAILFSFLGDVLLLFDFTKGGIAFICANSIYFIYSLIMSYKNTYLLIAWFVFIILFVISNIVIKILTKKYNAKKMTRVFLAYVTTISTQALFAILVASVLKTSHLILLSSGLFLFMVSDYFLLVHKCFNDSKYILRANSFNYFLGMLLVSLSVIL